MKIRDALRSACSSLQPQAPIARHSGFVAVDAIAFHKLLKGLAMGIQLDLIIDVGTAMSAIPTFRCPLCERQYEGSVPEDSATCRGCGQGDVLRPGAMVPVMDLEKMGYEERACFDDPPTSDPWRQEVQDDLYHEVAIVSDCGDCPIWGTDCPGPDRNGYPREDCKL